MALRRKGTPRLKRSDANSWRIEMSATIAHRNGRIDDIDVFYREAGPQDGQIIQKGDAVPSALKLEFAACFGRPPRPAISPPIGSGRSAGSICSAVPSRASTSL
jgi:hypothetical protein